ncbi:MAG: TIGR02186 family protein [Candidatus Puniceispirillaceae bacterium]
MMVLRAIIISYFLLGLSMPASAQDNVLVADVSQENVAITTTFHGTQLLLFGALSGEAGDDLIVVISGPEGQVATRRKEKVGGIWINTQSVIWKNAPSYYQIFTTRPLSQIADNQTLRTMRVGYQNLQLRTQPTDIAKDQLNGPWKDALARTMGAADLWKTQEDGVSVISGALFRVTVPLPKNIRPGDYDVRILHLRDGVLLAENDSAITVAKSGIGALIYRFAHDYSIFYGIFAVLFAVASGWLAAVAFRRG